MKTLRIGDWLVDPAAGRISRDGTSARLEARTMRLLLCLAEHAGEAVSIDDLLREVWSGVIVTPDSVYQAVASLRRLLGDDPRQPAYIATVPRLGYRMVAAVSPVEDPVGRLSSLPTGRKLVLAWIAAAICVAAVAGFALYARFESPAPRPQKSIAVLPFVDLTEGMKQEEFADGMTEELIDKLCTIPGLRVPSPTSSFYFRGKRIPVADIARMLGVTWLLDGSVRKSGARLRVATRLIRADSGYVVWSEAYDRPFDDILKVQDDIAGKVTKALRSSLEGGPPR